MSLANVVVDELLPAVPDLVARLPWPEVIESARWYAREGATEWGLFRFHLALARRGPVAARGRHLRAARRFKERLARTVALMEAHYEYLTDAEFADLMRRAGRDKLAAGRRAVVRAAIARHPRLAPLRNWLLPRRKGVAL